MRKFKVAMICDAGFYTGTYYYQLRMAEELTKLGLDVSLVTPVPLPNVKSKQLLLKWPIFNIPLIGRPSWLLFLYFRLKRYKFDVIHSAGYGMINLMPFDMYKNALKVTSVSDVMCDNREYRGKSFPMWFIAKILQPPHLRFNDFIIMSTYHSKEQIMVVKKVKENKLVVSHWGVSDSFKKVKDGKILKAVKKKFNLPGKFILNAGGLKTNKNIIRTVKAFEIISKSMPDVHMVFSSKLNTSRKAPYYHKELSKELEKLDSTAREKIHFLGFVNDRDLNVLYSLASVFLMASLAEGFGLPVIEAMKAGTPVITSNASCMPEVAGGAAMLCDPYNPKDIAKKVCKVLSDKKLADSLVQKGLARAKVFTWEKCAKRVYSFYEQEWNRKFGKR
jgi:glycosyltransferase involved in cell wall biosynthesis